MACRLSASGVPLMKFCQENHADIKKYFQGSFIKFPQAGDTVHFVDRVESTYIRGRLYSQNAEGKYEDQPFVFHLNPKDDNTPEVEFILPRKSYFNFDNAAYMLYRIPARQYHRGVTPDNTAIARLAMNGEFPSYNLGFDRLTAYVGKQAFCNFAQRGWDSYAVSRRCAVAACGDVFIDRTKVGRISYEGQGCITVHNEIFQSELERIVQEHGQQFLVKVAVKRPRAKKLGKGDVPKKAVVEEVTMFNEEVMSDE